PHSKRSRNALIAGRDVLAVGRVGQSMDHGTVTVKMAAWLTGFNIEEAKHVVAAIPAEISAGDQRFAVGKVAQCQGLIVWQPADFLSRGRVPEDDPEAVAR